MGTVIWVCHYGTYSKLSRPDFCWLGDLKWALSSGYVTMVCIVNFQDLTSAKIFISLQIGWEISYGSSLLRRSVNIEYAKHCVHSDLCSAFLHRSVEPFSK